MIHHKATPTLRKHSSKPTPPPFVLFMPFFPLLLSVSLSLLLLLLLLMASSSSSANNNNNKSISTTSGSDPTSPHTTFVQADPSTFRALVQKLTGVEEHSAVEKLPVTIPARQSGSVGPRRPAFKLQERRQNLKKQLQIQLGGSGGGGGIGGPVGGRYKYMGSEMMMISPVSPFDWVSRGSPRSPEEEEERAILQKGFYLHPSPLSTPRGPEPELLPLFPLSSPREPPSCS